MGLSFLKDFKKKLAKNEDLVTSFAPPSFWYSVGNYAVNKIISGSYFKGIPQGRITTLCGPSGCLPVDEVVYVHILNGLYFDVEFLDEDEKIIPYAKSYAKSYKDIDRKSQYLDRLPVKVTMEELKAILHTNSVLVETPDGFVPLTKWWNKNPRQLYKIQTGELGSLTCSNDHLVETPDGWVKADNLEIGDLVLTDYGIFPLVEITKLDIQPVFDFEIQHENQRYYAGTAKISSHNSGKSFLACNILANAQAQDSFVYVLDSEHALDTNYMTKIGMDLSEDKFLYTGVTTFNQVVECVSSFLKDYIKAYGYDNPEAPKVIIALDSLDMLITDSEDDHFEHGVQKGDQGQRSKQAKHMLRTIVSRIKRLPIAFLLTHQVYPNADITNGLGKWIVNNAVRYSASQIFLIESLKLKDGVDVTGVRMRVETYKSRFAKIGSKVEIEVPYANGMNKFSGFLELMEEQGIITSAGAWKKLQLPGQEPISFQTKHLDDELLKKIMSHPKLAEEEAYFESVHKTQEVLEEPEESLDAT